MKKLRIADDLALPLEIVTEKLAMLGRTGSGKSYAAMKLAELMLAAGAQVGAIDPVGVWRSLRIPAEPAGTAFDVVVFGGLYGDLPLEPTEHAGALIADVICDRGLSFVLDVSQFIPAEQQRFVRGFADRFFHRKKSAPSAVHLFMEECQEFIPENPSGEEAKTLGVMQRLWKLGRNFGIGGTLISQRPQEIAKKALNMSGTMFAFQMTGPQERAAVRKWVADQGLFEYLKYVLIDEAHLCNPAIGLYKQFFDALAHRGIRIAAYTATPYRLMSTPQGAMLKFLTRIQPPMFSEVAYYVQNGRLFSEGHLAKLQYHQVQGFDRGALQANSTGADYTDASIQVHFRATNFTGKVERVVRMLLPVVFEFTVESATWNQVVRDSGSPEYICLWCFDKLAVEAGAERIPVGVNVGGKVTHSAWCNDDVPGAYPGELLKADLENRLKERDAKIADLTRKGEELCVVYGNALLEIHDLKRKIETLEALLQTCQEAK